jgi:hypothetical protein
MGGAQLLRSSAVLTLITRILDVVAVVMIVLWVRQSNCPAAASLGRYGF